MMKVYSEKQCPLFKAILVLITGALMNFVLGSFYAWSVFLQPIQNELGVSRGEVSSVFSFTVTSYTIAMILAPYILNRLQKAEIIAGVSLMFASLGLALAAWGSSVSAMVLGYGIFFGMAIGLGFNFTLQLVNYVLPKNGGMATGIVVAGSALGGVFFTPLISQNLSTLGVAATLFALSKLLFISAVIIGCVLKIINIPFCFKENKVHSAKPVAAKSVFMNLWLGGLLSSIIGLVVIGHAAGIIASYGGLTNHIVLGTSLVGLGSAVGRLAAGCISDYFSSRKLLIISFLNTSLLLFVLVLLPSPAIAVASLGLISITNGAVSTAFATFVTIYFGREQLGKIFGRLTSAVGLAGLFVPWLAGLVFDIAGKYTQVITFAAMAALLGTIISRTLPEPERTQKDMAGHIIAGNLIPIEPQPNISTSPDC
jgi:MFS transporter, OFA family, oxalate/formate antiporter